MIVTHNDNTLTWVDVGHSVIKLGITDKYNNIVEEST